MPGHVLCPKNCPLAWGDLDPSNTWFLGPTRVHPKRYLDRFSRFCRAAEHGPLSRIRQVAPMCTARHTRFFGPTRVHNQNSISIGSAVFVQFTAESRLRLVFHLKLPLLVWVSEVQSNTWILGRTQVLNPKRHHYCDRQTDRPTDHATRSVTIGSIYVRSTAMRPKTNNRQ